MECEINCHKKDILFMHRPLFASYAMRKMETIGFIFQLSMPYLGRIVFTLGAVFRLIIGVCKLEDRSSLSELSPSSFNSAKNIMSL